MYVARKSMDGTIYSCDAAIVASTQAPCQNFDEVALALTSMGLFGFASVVCLYSRLVKLF